MINKDFIAGLVIGALRCEKINLSEQDYPFVEWIGIDEDSLRMSIKYNCAHYLEDLDEMERIVKSFCKVNSVVVGKTINIYIDTKEDGEQLAD